MKLGLQSLTQQETWKDFKLPTFDPAAVASKTFDRPTWIHFGAGNLFRAFPAVLAQRLIEAGAMETGVITCESYDDEIVTKCFHPTDNLTIAVTLHPDGHMGKEVIASVTETLTLQHDFSRVQQIFNSPSLQMVTFTITEKGYALRNADNALYPAVVQDMHAGPAHCTTFMAKLAALCLTRLEVCGVPLALSSLDNCAPNGEKLKKAVMEILYAWRQQGFLNEAELSRFVSNITFPCSMIDKITPRPDPRIGKDLEACGLENMSPIITSKKTYIAPFVNAEKPQYLVIEDQFPNGRPPLEQVGVVYTDRTHVDKVEQMKVCTCLNPPQTALAIFGCLLGYHFISDEMKDEALYRMVHEICLTEGMPVVIDSGIISAEDFVNEVLTDRLINPFIPDTPQRIATDTSQKLAIRFGRTINEYQSKGQADQLRIIPLVLAGWLRYLIGVDDNGDAFSCSPDPMLTVLQQKLTGLSLGMESLPTNAICELLADTAIFGCDLYECGLADLVVTYWSEMMTGPGAVRTTLHKYLF